MRQNILRKLMLIAVLLTGVNAFAHDFKVGGIYYNIISSSDLTVEVTYRGDSYNSYNNEYSGQVTIPETVTYNSNTYSVTSIGNYAFRDCSDLTSVTIGNSVTSIGICAFDGCSGLTSVTIPNSVTSIGDFAFYYCDGLTNVTIGNSVTSIGEDAFKRCIVLTSVNISDLEAWCKIDFFNADANPVYSANNLYLNNDKVRNLVIPNTITEIKFAAFYGCTLTSVIIPNNVTSIGSSAFRSCYGLTNVTIPNSVTSIGSSAFRDCDGLTSVTIPNSITRIGSSAFDGCSGLTSVTIPNSVTKIDKYAFSFCSGLTSVTIPNSVTSIGSSAFYKCSGLTSVVFKAENCTTMGSSTNPVFSGCTNLTSITIGDQVKNIPDYAFYKCSGLTSVTIPNSVTSIGYSAFEDCSGLTEVTLGSSVKEIDSEAFSGAKRLGKIYSLNPTPPTCADEDVFYNVNKDKCRVYVPIGAGIYYKIAIVWRHFTYIEEKEMSGVESTLTDNEVNVVVENGNIIVNGAEGANIEVYSTNGLCIYNGTDTGIAVNTKGLYIVKINGKSFKVIL